MPDPPATDSCVSASPLPPHQANCNHVWSGCGFIHPDARCRCFLRYGDALLRRNIGDDAAYRCEKVVVERDAALAERNLFGHLLSRIVDHWDHTLGHVNEFIANDIELARRALAEGSDVLPTQGRMTMPTDQASLGLASTRDLLTEVAVRMEVTQNSIKGRDLGRLAREALENLDGGVLDYRTLPPTGGAEPNE